MVSIDLKYYNLLLSKLLVGTTFVGFELDTCFRLRFEWHGEWKDRNEFPTVLILEQKATMWTGQKSDWEKFLESLPNNFSNVDRELPGMAYRLALTLGEEIVRTHIDDESTLTIVTKNNELICISGLENVWEESWLLYLPQDLKESELWSISCGAGGKIHHTTPMGWTTIIE